MEVKQRLDNTNFYCFSDNAPEELKDLFLEHYDIKDLDYQIFSKACDTISEVYEYQNNNDNKVYDFENYIQDNYNEFASVYTSDRIDYLDSSNDNEIAEIVINYKCESISFACAIWYDEQVQNAISLIINNYLNK